MHSLNFDATAGDYYKHANDEILVVLQTESPEGVENAEKIYSLPGVDAIFVGPNDLTFAPDGRLWLIHTAQKSGNQDTAFVRCRISADNGDTWGVPDAFGAALAVAEDATLWTGDPELLLDGSRWRWRDLRQHV